MKNEVDFFLKTLSSDWNSVKKQIEKYFDEDSGIRSDGAIQIFKRPWIAPLNYGILLFPAAEESWFEQFLNRTGIQIPNLYKELLLQVNGFFIYELTFFGLPKSIYESGLLDRSILQQLSLESANTLWINEFNINNDFFYIGSGYFNDDENFGYFIEKGRILSLRTNGEMLNCWLTWEDFFSREIISAENIMLKQKEL